MTNIPLYLAESAALELSWSAVIMTIVTALFGSGGGIKILWSYWTKREGEKRDAWKAVVDGKDVREYTLASLRSQVSVVLQDTILFSGTVRDNIACCVAEATPEQIEAAARTANAHEFILRLPQGYDTVVGERGATLSLGQKQRISVARAALRDAPILLLDEPTTGLDERNQAKVASAIKHVGRRATTILVTHDLRLTRMADAVLVVDRGRLVESGSPAELIHAGGPYAELHQLHTKRSEYRGPSASQA